MTPDDVTRLLDPEVAAALASSPLSFGTLTAAGLAERRAGMAVPQPYEPSGRVSITEVAVPGAPGDPEVTLRIHRPVELTGRLPCVYWMHGGGLVMGVASREDGRFESWCVRHGIVGVSVEYRLAPETPYPGPLEDCHAGLLHIHQRADDYGVDPSRIGIGGASAGAGLAAGLALLARDRRSVPIAFQLLVYPMIDDRMVTASSAWEVPVWSPASNRFGWSSYLPGSAGTEAVSPYAAAARAIDLAGLPPTLILVGALDGFLHEDVDYANRLMSAGVDTELHVYRGAPHGFDLMPGASISKRARRDAESWLAAQLERLASTVA